MSCDELYLILKKNKFNMNKDELKDMMNDITLDGMPTSVRMYK